MTLKPSTSLQIIGEIAGVNTASLGGHLRGPKTRARWAEGFHDELNGHVFNLERDGLRQVVNALMVCRPVSNRLTTIHLRNITIVQAYAQTSDYDDNKTEEFNDQLQNVINQTPKEHILLVLRD